VPANYFSGRTALSNIDLRGLTPAGTGLGGSSTDNSVFLNTALNGTITVPIAYQTNNFGSPDADLVYLAGRGWTINYV
jgi:hypothetical protein